MLIRPAVAHADTEGVPAATDALLAAYNRFVDEHGEVGGVVFKDVIQLLWWRARTQQPAA